MNNFLKKTSSIASLAIIAVSVPITIAVLNSGTFNFKINALLNDKPKNVVISDISGDSAYVTWETEKSVIGMVKLTGSNKIFTEKTSSSFHLIELNTLTTTTKYTFSVYSDGSIYNDNSYTVSTSNTVSNPNKTPFMIFGQVFGINGTTVQQEGLIYITVSDGKNISQKIPALLNKSGGFQVDISNLNFDYQKSVEVTLLTYYDSVKDPIQKEFTLDLSKTRQIPNIYLGDVEISVIPGVNGK